jgi:Carboxylesterase family/FG-GAP-like repeat
MTFLLGNWLQAMKRTPASGVHARPGAKRARPHRIVPRLEALEDRLLFSRGIALAAPIDFPTGAQPSAAAFNAVSGDQIGLATELQNAVAVGDLNGDGNPDVAVTNPVAGSVSVFLGDGDGSFAPAQTYQVGIKPIDVTVGDFNGDGSPDLAAADSGSRDVGILLGRGDGTFAPTQFVKVGNIPVALAVGEFDGNASPDLAVANNADGSVSILTGNGDGTFALTNTVQTPRDPLGKIIPVSTVAAGALGGDAGHQDLVVGSGASPAGDHVLVYLNHDGNFGKGKATDGSTIPDQSVAVGGTPRSIAVADLNGDDQVDLAVADEKTCDVTILLGDGHGTFASTQTVHAGQLIRSVAVGDLNGDGIPDLVTANFGSATVSVLQGNGDGTFKAAQDFWAGDEPSGVAVGDFDRGGRTDVVVGRIRTDQLSLLRNHAPHDPDRVQILRDINYADIPNDPNPQHHILDVYLPPLGTTSFAGEEQPYPVVIFAHGGAGIVGDKSGGSYLMRTLAREGIIAVSINYRLSEARGNDQITDVTEAFAWVYHHSAAFGGDTGNIFLYGHSAGAKLFGQLSTDPTWLLQQGLSPSVIRGAILVGANGIDPSHVHASQPPSLLLDGTEGNERKVVLSVAPFDAASVAAGAQVQWDIINGRDHLTLLDDMALSDDPARQAMLNFIAARLMPTAPSDPSGAAVSVVRDSIGASSVVGKPLNPAAILGPGAIELRGQDGSLVGLYADLSMLGIGSVEGDRVDGFFMLFGAGDSLMTELPPAFQGVDVAITRFHSRDPYRIASPVFALNFGAASVSLPALHGLRTAARRILPDPVPVFFGLSDALPPVDDLPT